ncbi:MAG: ROK family transcriptional regulator [Clostridium sp.]|uniref:ROK family transcriptional regulator n=1 Tax=Clostridium TaxID=1485 RepID=UPI001158813E|nr:ROK family transcriptional regulator [Clostridium sp.]MDU1567499.1 ROK family transcriptional regulator [Clostridium sp.]MDU2458999.1 ROK family transcriptional regulator [Clostridium sp.]MDU3349030.1 ROK family transcriptional regulator [Clostridium sp.]MDU3407190.1 ROK family transcriptional regulator [Clostridium sp.]
MDNKFNIRKFNIVEILNLLFKKPNISRIDISKLINLNKASVSEIVALLVEKNLVSEIGTGSSSSSGGRKPILLKINEKAGCSLGIDLGIDYVSFLLTDLNRNVLFYDYYEEIINKNNVIEIIVKVITSLEGVFKEYEYGLIGATLAVHGRVFDNKIKFTPYYDLDKMDLIKELSLLMPNINFYIENESNLAAVGEFENSVDPLDNAVVINVHSGIGAGIIINSKLYTGFEGRAGEIGHSVLIPNGKECPCGNKGCFEQYCSLPALLEDFNSKSDIKIRTIKELCDLYNSNNKIAIGTITKNIELMSIGISNIFNLFAADNIFIYSEITKYIPNYLNLINNKINTIFSKAITILPNKLDNKSNLFGGVNRCIYNFFEEFLDII